MDKKLTLLAFFIFLLFSCTSAKKESGVLRIGTDDTYPPFETRDIKTGKLVGFDIDLMKKICSELSLKPEFIAVPFDGIIAGLKQKKYDAIISAMTITKKRAKEISFSRSYYLAGQSVVVNIGNKSITDVKGLIGKKIGVQLGTTGEMVAKKISNVKVISYDSISAAFIDLEQNRIDAIINDIPTNRNIITQRIRKGSCRLKMIGDLLTHEHYGIAVRKDDTVLLSQINTILDKLDETGYLKKIAKKWEIGN